MDDRDRLELLIAFEQEMLSLHQRVLTETGFDDRDLLWMISTLGAFVTARMTLNWPEPSESFALLLAARRLDLTIESLVLIDLWHPLFSDDDRAIARSRLQDLTALCSPHGDEAAA